MRLVCICLAAIGAVSGCAVPHARGAAGQPDPAAEYLTDYVPGGTLTVARLSTPFTNSDGRTAAAIAAGFCARTHARLNPATFGHFNAGIWEFKRGCI